MRRKESHAMHERRESIGEEAAEHSCLIGTTTPDKQVREFVFGKKDKY